MEARYNDIALRPVSFEYPEGYQELANEMFDNLPEEERDAALLAFIRAILLY